MINPQQVMTSPDCKGLYESFYFRGNNILGTQAFWLKHNLLKYFNSDDFVVESSFIFFNKENNQVSTYQLSERISSQQFSALKFQDWTKIEYFFENKSFFQIQEDKLQGRLKTARGEVRWDLNLKLSHESYYHFSHDWFYHGFFPKKKILTKDIKIIFEGEIELLGISKRDQFIGMNGHNWGKEHAFKYAYGNCNQFQEDPTAYFDGFSAKIVLAGKLIKSPYLSGGSLKLKNTWYHFNQVLTSYQHQVSEISLQSWEVTLINKNYQLNVKVDGTQQLWCSLDYAHPSGKRSTVNNTKFAKACLSLQSKTDGLIQQLNSNFFELESLLP